MLIGVFILYRQFLPLYNLDIIPWRYILSKQPQPGTLQAGSDRNVDEVENEKNLVQIAKFIYI